MDFGEFPQACGGALKGKRGQKDPHGPIQVARDDLDLGAGIVCLLRVSTQLKNGKYGCR